MEELLLIKEERRIAKDLSFSYGGEIYQIETQFIHRMKRKKIEIYTKHNEIQHIELKGKRLGFKKWRELAYETPKTVDTKMLETMVTKKQYKPSKRHPWR